MEIQSQALYPQPCDGNEAALCNAAKQGSYTTTILGMTASASMRMLTNICRSILTRAFGLPGQSAASLQEIKQYSSHFCTSKVFTLKVLHVAVSFRIPGIFRTRSGKPCALQYPD
jgi:hypothetical protein